MKFFFVTIIVQINKIKTCSKKVKVNLAVKRRNFVIFNVPRLNSMQNVNHRKVSGYLAAYGIKLIVLVWFKSYSTERGFRV